MDFSAPNAPAIGAPLPRHDAHQKVTGAAPYAAEHPVAGVVYGVLLTSPIVRGRISGLDTAVAERAPGVLAIMTYRNAPKVPSYFSPETNKNPRVEGQEIKLFFDDQVHFSNQPVALAIADTLERAHHAAALVQVTYQAEAHQTDLLEHLTQTVKAPKEDDQRRGQPEVLASAPVQVTAEYHTPIQVHNPMETHAAIAQWDGNRLTVYNKTQAPKVAQKDLMRMFGLTEGEVRVHSPFVGGAFGGSSRIWPPEVAAILGAKLMGRPVKVMNERHHEFNMVGYRPQSVQRVALGATANGQLVAIRHEAFGMTSRHEQFTERILHPTRSGYACPNLEATYRLVPLDMSTPCWTRGPGETSGSFAIESAMDELAEALKMDPLALRLKNYADKDPDTSLPWTSKHLRACYERAAARFGWAKRPPQPRSMAADGWLVGWGMASGIYHATREKATARAQLRADGTLLVQSATADTGPGTATIMAQIAADASGVPIEQVRFELGDSALPPAPGQFGSHTAASVGTAVQEVCTALKTQLIALAVQAENQRLRQAPPAELRAGNGYLYLVADENVRVSYADLFKQAKVPGLEATRETQAEPKPKTHSGYSFSAHFVEVKVQPATGEVRVSRVVSALDVGRVLNVATARSQVYGAVTWGIGLALMEDAVLDHRHGRFVNADLASYHVPTNADVPAVEVIFIDEPDYLVSSVGAKGMGEIGLIGLTAAIANAVYHATGRRVRHLPITPDKLV